MKLNFTIPTVALMVTLLATGSSCATRPAEKVPVRVLIAGSLMIPFDDLERAYEAEKLDVDLQMEAHGSIQVIRHVAEIHELADLVVTADDALIPMLMGATRWQAFLYVTLPLAWRGIVAGAVMMWGRGISEFGAVVMLASLAVFVSLQALLVPNQEALAEEG